MAQMKELCIGILYAAICLCCHTSIRIYVGRIIPEGRDTESNNYILWGKVEQKEHLNFEPLYFNSIR